MNEKIPLILLHGALGSKDQFAGLEAKLQDDFKIFTLNFEGHGGRSTDREFSMDHFAENLEEFIETEKLAPANIFAFSMGGYVALKLALDHPEKIKQIMTLGTKFHWTPETANQEVTRLNPLKIEEKLPQFARQLEERHAPMDWHQVLSKTGEMMLNLGKGEAIRVEDFQKVDCPVLISLGSEDQMVTMEESEKITEAIARADFHLFEGFKHPIEQVNNGQLASKMREFFLS